jgi:CheY-like chemotaxis protein
VSRAIIQGEQTVVNGEVPASIMVVDDQPDNLKLMEDMLKRQGYGVRSFPRGRMALAAAGQKVPDLILLDITMPEMNGFEVCERLKADKKLASVPVIFLSALSEAISAVVSHLATRLAVEERWQYDLAATLCLIGCISLPAEAFERAYAGETLSADEEQMFEAHPASGARLLAGIPRLENVAEMIRQQHTDGKIGCAGASQRGACMLRIALEVDRQVLKTGSYDGALRQARAILHGFPEEMLLALGDYAPPEAAFERKRLPVPGLRALMVLEEDVLTLDGNFLIVRKGTTLNTTMIERIGNFAKTRGIRQPLAVRVMRPEGARPS